MQGNAKGRGRKPRKPLGYSFRMLAAGRVDYAVVNLARGTWNIAAMGLSGKIQPILSRSVIEDGFYVCFSKARVSPALVDAFSDALKQFKQTETFQGDIPQIFSVTRMPPATLIRPIPRVGLAAEGAR